jgi:hypothetical protein
LNNAPLHITLNPEDETLALSALAGAAFARRGFHPDLGGADRRVTEENPARRQPSARPGIEKGPESLETRVNIRSAQ